MRGTRTEWIGVTLRRRMVDRLPSRPENLLEGLTEQQVQAVTHGDGPLLVVAGPGSGKTTVIVRRVAHLTRVRGVDPASLLVVTFAKAAADSLKARAAQAAGPMVASRATFGTFHGLAYRILRQADPGRRLQILAEDRQLQLIRQIMRETGLNTDDETVLDALTEISRMRASTADPSSFKPHGMSITDFRQLWQSYTVAKQRLGCLDFDDLLHEGLERLQTRPELLAGCQKRYHHVLVDEFQDTNAVQWEMIRLLSEPRRNLCVVGDDDQAIYGWRGASPDFLLSFPRAYPDARRVTLDLNHRCPSPIVAATNRLAAANGKRFGKVIRPARDGGFPVEVINPADSLQEAEAVVHLIKGCGAPLTDWAIIYRTNQQAHAIAQVMAREKIPYRALGGLPNLYRRWPVQDVLAYLKAATGEPFALEPVLNRPTRYLSRAVAQEARRIAEATGLDLLSAIAQTGMLRSWQLRPVEELRDHLHALLRMQAPDAIGYVRTIIGYDDYIREYAAREGGSADEMLGLLAEVERTSPRLMLTAFLAQVETFSSQAGQKVAEGDEAVTLVTCHKAKGLEFRRVVVVGAIDKLLPHRGSDDIEEERRLMYVAMTRAGERLWLSAPRAYEGREAQPSPFLEEALGPDPSAAD